MEDATGPAIAHGGKPSTAPSRQPHIVIIGAGFGGLSAAMRLGGLKAAVTVIDRRNYHLFQPLLYQVATAALSPADIAAPIRGVLSRQANARVTLGTVTGIDTAGRAVLIGDRRIPYDQLVIATGARESYFGHDTWAAVTSGLKTIEDAEMMRRRILIAFERAEACLDEIERRRQLTFCDYRRRADRGRTRRRARRAGESGARPRLPPYRPDHRAHRSGRGRSAVVAGFSGESFKGGGPSSDSARGRSPARRQGDELRRGRRHARRRANRQPHRDLGRRGRRVAGRRLAWYRARTWRPGAGRAGPDPARASRDLCDRRHGPGYRPSRAAARRSTGRQAAGRLCRPRHRREAGRQTVAGTVPVSRLRQSRHDRPPRGGGRFRLVAPDRPLRVAGLGCGAHLFPDRLPQPLGGGDRLAVVVPDLSARRPADHWARHVTGRDDRQRRYGSLRALSAQGNPP